MCSENAKSVSRTVVANVVELAGSTAVIMVEGALYEVDVSHLAEMRLGDQVLVEGDRVIRKVNKVENRET
jgi:hypothetical protein